MKTNFHDRIEALRKLPPKALRTRYFEIFGEQSRSGNRQFLFRRVAWRMQALAEFKEGKTKVPPEILRWLGTELFKGTVFRGVATQTYDVPALAAGQYSFVCTVHPTMIGTLTGQ